MGCSLDFVERATGDFLFQVAATGVAVFLFGGAAAGFANFFVSACGARSRRSPYFRLRRAVSPFFYLVARQRVSPISLFQPAAPGVVAYFISPCGERCRLFL